MRIYSWHLTLQSLPSHLYKGGNSCSLKRVFLFLGANVVESGVLKQVNCKVLVYNKTFTLNTFIIIYYSADFTAVFHTSID